MTISPTADASLPVASSAPTEEHRYELGIVGGGLSGLSAALSAARMGVRTVLIQDRAVLGGNASSEIRMWPLGARGPENRESGIMEEILLANLYHNANRRYSLWDDVLYGLARNEPSLEVIFSCSVCEVEMAADDRIQAVRAWHLTRQRWLHITADAFIDCSGDSILRLSGAPCRWGREARSASGEPHGQEQADRRTMGNTILIQLREIDPAKHEAFRAPSWALPVADDTFPKRKLQPTGHNFWFLELGGMGDTIADADQLRDELMALAYGVWNYIKNHPDGRGHNWELEWIGALPGKRENVRYEGDHVLSEDDINARGQFDDLIAHGGWTMDDHPPKGMYHDGRDTTHHPAPSPYGIPYRSLYSRTVKNLWFAGRNISATHMAMSSTRVMATCSTMGQAAGIAAAIAIQQGCDNRGVHSDHLERLQRRLLDQDQWLPGRRRPASVLTTAATITCSAGDAAVLTNGTDRILDGIANKIDLSDDGWVQLSWPEAQTIDTLRLVGDSSLRTLKVMPCSYPLSGVRQDLPGCLPRDLRIVASDDGSTWTTVDRITDNHRRLITWQFTTAVTTRHLRIINERSWGDDAGLFAVDVGQTEPTGAIATCDWPTGVIAGGGSA